MNYPAALAECVCVGAIDTASKLAWFSNYGTAQELVAPGVDVFATGTGGTYVSANGTSMATPQVSGVAALILGVDGSLSASRVRAILAVSAIDMGRPGRDATYGYGLVNAWRALAMARAVTASVQPADGMRICRGRVLIPAGVRSAVVCDATGRRIANPLSGATRELRVGPGAYLMLLQHDSGRVERRKVLVTD
uniref:Peptidase S8/S53 domain-containing protein n=1 Tax=candidate division WOR-3 bacterium TaxID=2052148 RepID=A0A7C4GFN9_UNCW3